MTSPAPAPVPPVVTHRSLLAIAVPMMLGFLTTPLVGIVDMAVIGRLGDPALTAGVALGSIVTDVLFSTCNFLRSGTTGLTAQAEGRGDRRERGAILIRAGLIAAAIGLALMALAPVILWLAPGAMQPSPAAREAMLSYILIRLIGAPLVLANFALFGWVLGQGRSGLGLALLSILNGVNMALALIFVGGFGWGVSGVALAAVLADAAALAAGLAVTWGNIFGAARPRRADILDARGLKAMLAVNGDIMIRSFVLLVTFAFFARQGALQGDVVLSANAILEKFFLVGGYFLDGFATAAETFTGQAIGARDRDGFARAIGLSALWGFPMAAALSLVIFGFGHHMVAAMTVSPEVRAASATYLPWAALTPLIAYPAFLMDGVYIGATWSRDMRNMMLASLALFLAAWAVTMPLLGNHGLWLAFMIFLSARGASLGALLPGRIAAAFRSSSASAH